MVLRICKKNESGVNKNANDCYLLNYTGSVILTGFEFAPQEINYCYLPKIKRVISFLDNY